MTMTDPVADMLTRLRNANSAHHDSVALPSSKLKTHIAEILKQEGYISEWNGLWAKLKCFTPEDRDAMWRLGFFRGIDDSCE